MTSKNFKSAMTDNRELEVDVIFSKPRLLIKEFDGDNTGFVFAPSDAPALALAILEAAGVNDTSTGGLITHDRVAVTNLKIHIEKQERATAEARERAELEAEALELVNAWRAEGGEKLLERWDAEEGDMIQSKSFWLAVARRARELAKEATK